MAQIDDRSKRKVSWGRCIAIFCGIVLALVIVAYFVGTSSAFVKSFVLPRVGNAVNAKITVGEVSVRPFSRLNVRQLRVETTGAEPLLTAEEATVRYSLMAILKGNIKVDEVTLVSPVINLVQEADGSNNLDPLTKSEKQSKPESKEPIKLSIQNVSLKNGTVRQTVKGKDGSLNRTELQALALDLDHLGNGQAGHLKLSSSLTLDQRQGGTNSLLGGEVSGGYDVSLNQELMPDTINGSVKLTVSRAEGSFKELAGFSGSLDADLTPKEIRQAALRFSRNNQPLGQVRISGPMDMEKKEGNLKLEINSIDKNVLALATAGKGYDFGDSQVNATNQVVISQGGTFFSANGNLAATRITLSQGTVKTPEMNLNLDYQVAVNTGDKSAVLQKANLTGSVNGKEFLRTELDRQMNLSWGEKVQGFRDAALNLFLTNFNLADWRTIIGTNVNAGLVSARVALTSQQDGHLLNTDFAARVDGFSAQFGSNRLENAAITLAAAGGVEKLQIVNLTRYSLAIRQGNAQVLQASGSARYVVDSKDATAQLTLDGALPQLLALAALPQANASVGTLRGSARFTDDGSKKTVVGNLGLANFTGGYQQYAFSNFSLGFEYNVDLTGKEATLNRTALSFTQAFSRGGSVELKGKYNFEDKSGQFTFNTVDLNQAVFGPLLAPSLGDNQLVSITLNASGEARLDPQAESSVTANVKLANWVVQDKAGTLPKTPLAVEMQIEGGMKKEALDLRKFLVQLTPTPRAKNALQVEAKLDFAKTNAAPSTLSLTSESFDVTPYYDMFAGKKTTDWVAQKSAPSATPQEQKEPEPMQLPFQQLTADLKIDRLFLREVAISNWIGKVAMRSNVVKLSPFQLQLNGGPMSLSGTVNVGSPGYIYDLALKADAVPLAALANSFGSGKSNAMQGNFIADAQIHGAGTTGPNLRKNLGGNMRVDITNLNYQIVGPKLRQVLVPISVALRVPELLDTPINWLSAQTDIGNGVINLKHLGVESEAFYAESAGTITLADVLTNSALRLPLDISLRRSLAQKTGFAPAGTTTNDSKYAKIPRFVSVKGTLGSPSADLNELALVGTALRGAAALGLGGAGKTGEALGAVGNLLTGQTGGTNGAATNNVASSLAQSLGGLLGGKSAPATNHSARSGTNAPATNALQNTIDSLLRPKPKSK